MGRRRFRPPVFPRAVRRGLAAAWLGLVAATAGCAGGTRITLTPHDLRPIEAARGHYELWALAGTAWTSAGKFTVDATGPRDLAGAPKAAWSAPLPAGRIEMLVLTQEPPGDADAEPSRQTCLRGKVAGGRSRLVPGIDAAALSGVTGAFLLDNPVTVDVPDDRNGVWFARYVNRRYKPGLMLGDAPAGWLWAGWVILDGHALRTGKFRNGGDNDDWAGYSGRTGASPLVDPAGRPMPGEDFIAKLPAGLPTGRDRPDLAGAEVLVTLEDATLANEETWPSPVVIFRGRVPAHPTRLAAYDLENVAAKGLPAIDAVLE